MTKKKSSKRPKPDSIYFSNETKRLLREKAEFEGRSFSATVIRIVEAFLDATS